MPSRDPWLDNAKFALITLVVVGHAWAMLPNTAVVDQAYNFLYLWHMPAFVLIAGYLSRRFDWTAARLWQLVRTVAVPYVLFEAAFALFRQYVRGERLGDLFVDPHWPLWFLTALFCWRLSAPVFLRLPRPVALGTAVVASLLGGFWSTETLDHLDLARTLGFLPFFVLGLTATPQRLERLRRPWVQVAGGLVLAATVVGARFVDTWASTDWLYYGSYHGLGAGDPRGVLTRAVLLTVALACTLGFLALVPRVRGRFTDMGGATMVVYLCHGLVILAVEALGFEAWAAGHELLAAVAVVLGGATLAWTLAWRPVASRLDVVVDPIGYAQRRATRAVDLAMAADAPPPAPARQPAGARVA